jgi:hypothetical protein
LLDGQGRRVGRMYKDFAPPQQTRCVEAKVAAIVVWRRQADAKFATPKCERWEVVLPELVFAGVD